MTPEQIRLLRERLGLSEEQLPDDATQEQINNALSGETTPPPEGEPESPPAPGEGETPPGEVPPPSEGQPTPEAVAAARSTLEAAGLVAVPSQGWQEVQANAAAGARVAQQTETQRRAGIIAKAIQDGRIAPAQRDNFRQMFDRDPQGTEQLLTAAVDKGGLMPGTIPVEARGADPAASDLSQDAYPSSWLPELHTRDGAGAPAVTVEA